MATSMTNSMPDSNSLYAIAYISTASASLNEADLDEILCSSRQFNQTWNITGVLFYHEGVFFQYIEGPAYQIKRLIKRIARSRKHNNLTVLKEDQVAEHLFANWTMAFNQNPIALIGEKQQGLDVLNNPFVILMQDFWSRNNRRYDALLGEQI